jgi:hypothetical protein
MASFMFRTSIALVFIGATLGCSKGERSDASPDTNVAVAPPPRSSGGITQSMDALLRRFQAESSRQDTLVGTSATRDALTRRYLAAVARFDTTALRDMHITRAEYAYLFFPSSKMMTPPYDLPPDVAWLLHTGESNKGIAAVIRRFGGQSLQFESVRCPREPLREGPNIVWRGCVVRYWHEGGVREAPLFAAIIEREGRFKFFSYATPL